MVVPDSVTGVAILLALVIPGVVFAAVRLWLRGFRWTDQSVSNRIFDAVLVSVVLDALYLVFFGRELASFAAAPRAAFTGGPQEFGLYLLWLGVLIPSALALVLYFRPRWWHPPRLAQGRFRWLRVPAGRMNRYDSTPTAWDKIAPTMGDTWIRIQLPDGRRIGGWFSSISVVAVFPQLRDIFIEEQYEVHPDGSFGDRVENTRGVWITVPDQAIVEWLDAATRPTA